MFEGLFQPTHLLIIIVIAMFVFGPKKIPELGKGLGEAIRGFKNAVNDGDNKAAAASETSTTPAAATTTASAAENKPQA